MRRFTGGGCRCSATGSTSACRSLRPSWRLGGSGWASPWWHEAPACLRQGYWLSPRVFCHARQAPAACKLSSLCAWVSGRQRFRAHFTNVAARSFAFRWRLLGVTELVSTVQNQGQCGSYLALLVEAFAAALEATSVSVRASAEYWNDYAGVTTFRHPEELLQALKMPVDSVPLPVKQYVPRLAAGVNWGVEVVSVVFFSGSWRILLDVLYNSCGGSCAGSGWIPRGSLFRRSSPLHPATVRSSQFFVASIGVS